MSPLDPLFWLLVLGSFVSSAVSGIFGIGGGFIMLALIGSFVPIGVVVPMHSALALGLSAGRAWYFREHVHWAIVVPFVLGCLIGAPLGARIYLDLPEVLIASVIGLLLLLAVWMPPVRWRPRIPHPFFYVGVVHSLLSAMFSFGGFMQPLMLRTSLDKLRIIGTLAVSLLVMNLFKLAGYAAFGFDFGPYVTVIIACILAGIPGARVGKHLVHHVSEERFRQVFRVIMTLFAARLLYRAWLLA